jgi:hypothetical protein
VALNYFAYNFIKIHRTLRMTPAMAGVTNRLWEVSEFGNSLGRLRAEGGKSSVTRFKELKRIEVAIEHRNRPELDWAAGYCKMRIQIATRKDHQKYWRRIEKNVQQAMDNSK